MKIQRFVTIKENLSMDEFNILASSLSDMIDDLHSTVEYVISDPGAFDDAGMIIAHCLDRIHVLSSFYLKIHGYNAETEDFSCQKIMNV